MYRKPLPAESLLKELIQDEQGPSEQLHTACSQRSTYAQNLESRDSESMAASLKDIGLLYKE